MSIVTRSPAPFAAWAEIVPDAPPDNAYSAFNRRDIDGAAGLPAGVEVVRGDLSDPNTLDACLEGIGTVFLVWPFLTTEAAPQCWR